MSPPLKTQIVSHRRAEWSKREPYPWLSTTVTALILKCHITMTHHRIREADGQPQQSPGLPVRTSGS